jgi:glucose/arabinose dehydrogenase
VRLSPPAALVALAVLGACVSGEPVVAPTGPTAFATGPTGSPTTEPPTPEPGPPPLREVQIELRRVAVLEQPVALAVRAADPSLYLAEKTGRVVALDRDGGSRVVLDLSGEVSLGSEQGLLGIAFSPDGRFLYADLTDPVGDTRLLEFRVLSDGAIDPDGRLVLHVPQPFSNHNGGQIAFGPDGYLYVALGDGGAGGDPDGNAQSLATLLGKILRIDPRPTDGRPYEIPPDNPFVGRDDARPEIWVYGLRNPWRFSFDRTTGDLWIGDVGQDAFEEIDVLPAGSAGGANLGWDRFEGPRRFEGDADRREMVFPVHTYEHDGSVCAVTGGYAYRGSRIADLAGAYLFADFCTGEIQALRRSDERVEGPVGLGPVVPLLSSFGEDAEGELYVLSLAGEVLRVVPA